MKSGRIGRPPKYTEPMTRCTVRIPTRLHKILIEAAKANGWSVNDEVIARLSAKP